MALTSYIEITPEQEELFFKSLKSGDRFTFPRITRKLTLFSVKRVKGLTQRSLLPQIADIWNSLSDSEKAAWSNAGAQMGLNGYRLFVQDQSIRIKNNIPGVATPSLLHQSWVGYLNIEAPATEIKIAQYHPRAYWVLRKVTGKKGMYEPVEITEDFSLPLKIALNYKSNLTSQGEGAFAKFYAQVWHSYQGYDFKTNLEIPLDFSCDWKHAENTLNSVAGYVVGYTLYFHLYNLRGTLLFDNIKVVHSGQNWARDPFCNNINEAFTKAFFQIPKHWVAIVLPNGATFESIYPT